MPEPLDIILFDFTCAFEDAAGCDAKRGVLDDFANRFPEHAGELVEFACELVIDDFQPALLEPAPLTDEGRAMVERTMQRLRERLPWLTRDE